MKKLFLLIALLACSGIVQLRAQTTLSSPSPSYYTYGYSGGGSNVGIMFMITNNNSSTIYINKIGYANYVGGGTHEIWHSATSLTGFGNVSVTNGWTLDGTRSAGSSTYSSTVDDSYWSNLCIAIPANTTYRFAAIVSSTSSASYGITLGGPMSYTNTANNVTIDVNSYWGNYNNLSLTGYIYIGSVTFTTCAPPTGGAVASNIKSSSADLTWTSSPGTTWEYSMTTTPAPGSSVTSTTSNTFSASSLTPSTTYYVHVRKSCSSTEKSCWSTTSFTTLPPCTPPANFNVTALSPFAASFEWDPVVTAISYDYVIDQSRDVPAVTGVGNTALNSGTAAGLTEGTQYFFHGRTNCDGEQTGWSLDSFVTPIPCRAPVVKTDYINTTEAVAFWDEVKTATEYEYAVTKSATPPSLGTKIEKRTILMSSLLDGVKYYVHVRSHCSSEGIVDKSPWATTMFQTFPLTVNSINGDKLGIEVYPNPAEKMLNIKLHGDVQQNATVTLTDITGKILKQANLTSTETTMDISSFAPGIYQLQYKDDVNNKTIKVTKQ